MIKKIIIPFLIVMFMFAPVSAMADISGLETNDIFQEKLSDIPKMPKNTYFKTVLKRSNNSKRYYYLVKTTKKAGYKHILKINRAKDGSNGITNVHMYDRTGEEEYGMLMDVEEGKTVSGKAYLKCAQTYYLEICKDAKIYDNASSNLKIILKEIPMAPSKVKIISKKRKGKSIVIKYTKSKYATKYQIKYKYKGKWRSKTSKKTTIKINKKAKSFKIRAIRVVNNKNYYGKWIRK